MTTIKRLFDIPNFQLKNYNLSVAFVTKYHGEWQAISSKDYVEKANNLSKSLLELGIQINDKIAIITNRTRTEWHITDIGLMQIGAQSVPIYDSTSANEMEYIFNHAEIKYCFVATEEIFIKINNLKDKIPTLKEIISFDIIKQCNSLNNLLIIGKGLNNLNDVELIKNKIKEDDLATIIYTSGTTDKPKGVMLSHKNVISNVLACTSMLPIIEEKTLKSLSFLPVSHIFERMMLYLYQYTGASIYFAESIDTISADLNVVKPHIITAVPRLIEKIHDGILAKGNQLSGIKKRLFNWAIELGYAYKPDGKNGSKYERNLKRARKLIFSKWKAALGGNIKVIFCGSSKLQPKLARIFCAAELYLMDGYGLTETSPVISANAVSKGMNKIGSIGKPISNVAIKIAADGEILIKGPGVMQGYYKNSEKTKQTIKHDYLYTGDLGKLDDEGFLYITGRKKEIFKTSGGKYISPSKIEIALKKSILIEQAVVIGEGEKMPAVIIQPNFEWFINKYPNLNNIELIKNNEAINLIQKEIDLVNHSLGQWEKIKNFELTPDEWSVAAGHLTPTLKVKKDIIKTKYYILYNKIYRPFQE
ncbi:MAG: AMP-dependent synthetase/ligase [Flavobacteriaceae bacterium]|nr:AMP-dependent synthetase/ligase [Flavobacteriaceae bacterium]